tara:strand:- start:367 stop:1566 length:1200 start_codon:yes stop_codon:yes gene_type:complete
MITLSSSTRGLIVGIAALFLLTASDVSAAIKQSNFPITASTALSDRTAGWLGVNESSASGDCHLLVTLLRTKVLGYCALVGGAPLTEIQLWVDGFDTPVFTTPVVGDGPFSFTVDPAPALLVRAFSNDSVKIQGHTIAGLEIEGPLRRPYDVTTFAVPVHGGEVVPPSNSRSLAICLVTVLAYPSFLGVDCSHNLIDPQIFELYGGPAYSTGLLALDLTSSLGETTAAYWQPLDNAVSLAMAIDRTYLRMVGATENDIIRGQINGCRTSASTVCMFGRFQVRAQGSPSNDSTRQVGATGELLAAPFESLIVTDDEVWKTQTALFSLTGENEQSLLVEMSDGCSTGRGIALNIVGTDFERFDYFVFFSDLLLGYSDQLTTAGGYRLERRLAYAMPCPPQR